MFPHHPHNLGSISLPLAQTFVLSTFFRPGSYLSSPFCNSLTSWTKHLPLSHAARAKGCGLLPSGATCPRCLVNRGPLEHPFCKQRHGPPLPSCQHAHSSPVPMTRLLADILLLSSQKQATWAHRSVLAKPLRMFYSTSLGNNGSPAARAQVEPRQEERTGKLFITTGSTALSICSLQRC